jgi:hypothetical protein
VGKHHLAVVAAEMWDLKGCPVKVKLMSRIKKKE